MANFTMPDAGQLRRGLINMTNTVDLVTKMTDRSSRFRSAAAFLVVVGAIFVTLGGAEAQQLQLFTEPAQALEGQSPQVSTLPHDLSPWGMFMAADWVVKAVMIGLALASLATWTIWLAKTIELAAARRTLGRALEKIIASSSLEEAGRAIETGNGGPASLLVRAAGHETVMSAAMFASGWSPEAATGLKERIASHLGRIEAQASRRMTRGTGILATVGSIAPFVGLFGTVWGIMNSFIGISQSQTTNLAIVAPGIAEALLATALGLVAAIPAVMIYNGFTRSIAGYRLMLADTSAAVERLVSRDLDRKATGTASAIITSARAAGRGI